MVLPMAVGQRKEKRLAAPGVSKGELYPPAPPGSERYVDVACVRDISTHGICLYVGSPLERGEKVRLGYTFGRIHIHSCGFVAWCAPAV